MPNLRAALLMTAAMALFAVEDALMKGLAARLPVGQVLAMTGALAAGFFWLLIAARGGRLWTRELLHPLVMLRNVAEGLCSVLFLAALALGDMATASAVLQALPLLITLGGAVILGEHVGWRRWTSIAVGLVGVVLVVRPGTAAFQPASALAVAAVLLLALRDLATRRIPPGIDTRVLTASAFAAMVPCGLIWMAFETQPATLPTLPESALITASVAFGLTAYVCMVQSMRLAELPVIAPFRYTRLFFALILAVVVFGERPEALTLTGAAIIAAAGIHAMWREARLSRPRRAPPSATPSAPV